MLLQIIENSAKYHGDSGRIQPNPTNPAIIGNCYLPVLYLNRRTSRNGLKILQFSMNPANS